MEMLTRKPNNRVTHAGGQFAGFRWPHKPTAVATSPTQPKLSIGPSDDAREQQAEKNANLVMAMTNQPVDHPCPCGGSCPECRQNPTMLAESPVSSITGTTTAPDAVSKTLNTTGEALPPEALDFFESRFGDDFRQVRIHTDAHAEESSRIISARAYTVDNHIVFGRHQYSPLSHQGRHLLAHELSHVQQQRVSRQAQTLIQRQDAAICEHDSQPGVSISYRNGRCRYTLDSSTARVWQMAFAAGFKKDIGIVARNFQQTSCYDNKHAFAQYVTPGFYFEVTAGNIVAFGGIPAADSTNQTCQVPQRVTAPSTTPTDSGEKHKPSRSQSASAASVYQEVRKNTRIALTDKSGSTRSVPIMADTLLQVLGEKREQTNTGIRTWYQVRILSGPLGGDKGMIRARLVRPATQKATQVLRLDQMENTSADRELDPLPSGKNYRADADYLDNIAHTSYDVKTGTLWLVYKDASRIRMNYQALKKRIDGDGGGARKANGKEQKKEILSQDKLREIADRHGVDLPEGEQSTSQILHDYYRDRSTGKIYPEIFSRKNLPNIGDAIDQIEVVRGDAELALGLGEKILEIPIIGPVAAPRSATRGLFKSGSKGLRRLSPAAREWLMDNLSHPQKISSLIRAGDDIIDAVNRFHHVAGFDQVINTYVAGGNNQKGMRLVLRFVQANFKTIPKDMVFEQVITSGARIMDLLADGVKYEFKAVSKIRRRPIIGKGMGRQIGQLQRDLADLISQEPLSSGKLRWVFDKNQGLTRPQILRELRKILQEESIFRNHPRLNDILVLLDDIVMVW